MICINCAVQTMVYQNWFQLAHTKQPKFPFLSGTSFWNRFCHTMLARRCKLCDNVCLCSECEGNGDKTKEVKNNCVLMTYTIITRIFHTCCVYTTYCMILCFFSSQPIGHARMPLGLQTREMAMVRTILLLILCYIICATPITVLFLLSCCDELFHEHSHQDHEHAFNSTHNAGHDHLGLVNFVMHLDANENEPHVHPHHFDHDVTCYYLHHVVAPVAR